MENLLYALPMLACPVGMGLMMWLMSRGGHHQSVGPAQPPARAIREPGAAPSDGGWDDRLGRLRAELRAIDAQQAELGRRVARLVAEGRPAEETRPVAPTFPVTSIGGQR